MEELLRSIDWAKVITSFRDLIVSASAIITARAAWIGVSKWQSEEAGKASFDLARRVLAATYRLRDAIRDARSTRVYGIEYPTNFDEEELDRSIREEACRFMFSNRYAPVHAALRELQTLLPEVEASWGGAAREPLDSLGYVLGRLQRKISQYVATWSNKHSYDLIIMGIQPEWFIELESAIFDFAAILIDEPEKPNEMTRQINNLVSKAEQRVRRQLQKAVARPKLVSWFRR